MTHNRLSCDEIVHAQSTIYFPLRKSFPRFPAAEFSWKHVSGAVSTSTTLMIHLSSGTNGRTWWFTLQPKSHCGDFNGFYLSPPSGMVALTKMPITMSPVDEQSRDQTTSLVHDNYLFSFCLIRWWCLYDLNRSEGQPKPQLVWKHRNENNLARVPQSGTKREVSVYAHAIVALSWVITAST